jgi:hypothetical protein
MWLSRLFSYSLLSVLFVQLCLIDFSIVPAEYSFGKPTASVAEAEKITLRQTPSVAQYTSVKKPYDSLIFVGDVLLARNIEFLMQNHGDDYPYQGFAFTELAQHPAVIGNFESSIPKIHAQTPSGSIKFSVHSKYIPALAQAGFSHVSLANNHSLDYADAGLVNTDSVLNSNQIISFGNPKKFDAASVEFIEVDGKTAAIIAAYTLEQLPTYSQLKEVFTYASFRSDLQIVYVHWGTEYVSKRNVRQREAAERFVDAGADLIIGHHPHVVQNIELVNNVPVFYSLGNYIFDQYDSTKTQEGLLLHLELSDVQSKITLLPMTSVGTLSQPRSMKPREHADFLVELAKISDDSLQDSIMSGQILLGKQVASSSKVAIMNR